MNKTLRKHKKVSASSTTTSTTTTTPGVIVKNKGSSLPTVATTLDFTGSGVTATGTGSTKTITFDGGISNIILSEAVTITNLSSASSNVKFRINEAVLGGGPLTLTPSGTGLTFNPTSVTITDTNTESATFTVTAGAYGSTNDVISVALSGTIGNHVTTPITVNQAVNALTINSAPSISQITLSAAISINYEGSASSNVKFVTNTAVVGGTLTLTPSESTGLTFSSQPITIANGQTESGNFTITAGADGSTSNVISVALSGTVGNPVTTPITVNQDVNALTINSASSGTPITKYHHVESGANTGEQLLSNSLASSDLELATDTQGTQIVAVRIPVDLESSVTMSEAKLMFALDESSWSGQVVLDITAQLINNAPALSTTNDDFSTSNRSRTSNTVTWTIASNTDDTPEGLIIYSADIKVLINEILALSGWQANNYMCFFISHSSGTSRRVGESYITSGAGYTNMVAITGASGVSPALKTINLINSDPSISQITLSKAVSINYEGSASSNVKFIITNTPVSGGTLTLTPSTSTGLTFNPISVTIANGQTESGNFTIAAGVDGSTSNVIYVALSGTVSNPVTTPITVNQAVNAVTINSTHTIFEITLSAAVSIIYEGSASSNVKFVTNTAVVGGTLTLTPSESTGLTFNPGFVTIANGQTESGDFTITAGADGSTSNVIYVALSGTVGNPVTTPITVNQAVNALTITASPSYPIWKQKMYSGYMSHMNFSDTDGDGYMTYSELYSMITGMGMKSSNSEINQLLAEADLDGDSKISLAEFQAIINS